MAAESLSPEVSKLPHPITMYLKDFGAAGGTSATVAERPITRLRDSDARFARSARSHVDSGFCRVTGLKWRNPLELSLCSFLYRRQESGLGSNPMFGSPAVVERSFLLANAPVLNYRAEDAEIKTVLHPPRSRGCLLDGFPTYRFRSLR